MVLHISPDRRWVLRDDRLYATVCHQCNTDFHRKPFAEALSFCVNCKLIFCSPRCIKAHGMRTGEQAAIRAYLNVRKYLS